MISFFLYRLQQTHYTIKTGRSSGNSTENPFAKFGSAEIIGFDSDDNMLEKARHDHPDLKFVKGFAPDDFCRLGGKFDLVFSNAFIHWIPNQEKLINENEQKEFLNDLQNTIDGEYPLLADGNVFLVMPRLFFIAE